MTSETELKSCVKVEGDVLGSRPYKPTISVDVKQHFNINMSETKMTSITKTRSAQNQRHHFSVSITRRKSVPGVRGGVGWGTGGGGGATSFSQSNISDPTLLQPLSRASVC